MLAPLPPILSGRRIAVLGSAAGLGLAVAQAAEAAGAEVHGIDEARRFDALTALYRAELTDPDALEAAAAALPDGLDGLALFPEGDADPARCLARTLLAPRHLAEALAPRLAPGAAIVLRGAPPHESWGERLGETRAAMALRHGDVAGFVARWGLAAEPVRAARTAGWALAAWAMANRWRWPGLRINTLTPAAPDGRLPPAIAAARGQETGEGPAQAAMAAVFLLSGLSAGMTGANLAVDGGQTAQILSRIDGL